MEIFESQGVFLCDNIEIQQIWQMGKHLSDNAGMAYVSLFVEYMTVSCSHDNQDSDFKD